MSWSWKKRILDFISRPVRLCGTFTGLVLVTNLLNKGDLYRFSIKISRSTHAILNAAQPAKEASVK